MDPNKLLEQMVGMVFLEFQWDLDQQLHLCLLRL
jgi:hypothetical protein